jgi:DNA repair protein RadC
MEKITLKVREIQVKYKHGKTTDIDVADSPERMAKLFSKILPNNSQEHFLALYFDSDLKPIAYAHIATGYDTGCAFKLKDVFCRACQLNASGIVIAHNHPSGSLVASKEDYATTEGFKDACKLLGFRGIDHMIIGDGQAKSLETGMTVDF